MAQATTASPDLIAVLQSLPEGRRRRRFLYPQWFLLMAFLGILSDCLSARDLERFARRHWQTFNQALDQVLSGAPCNLLPAQP